MMYNFFKYNTSSIYFVAHRCSVGGLVRPAGSKPSSVPQSRLGILCKWNWYKDHIVAICRIGLGLLLIELFFSGCLQTRAELKESEQRQVMQQQVVSLQKNNADYSSRFSDLDDQMRTLNGRVDALQEKVHRQNQNLDAEFKSGQTLNAETNKKMEILSEAVGKLELQVQQLSSELELIKTSLANSNKGADEKSKKSTAGRSGLFDVAEEHFHNKEWKKAILNYQKYREENPKGAKVPNAVYKMGVCFQELNMEEDAKTFYEEVLGKFPKSDDARRAKSRLKNLKK